MTPALRCECVRRDGMGGFWFWQYSLAMVIVLAALLDSVWWVPAHQHNGHRAAVPAQIARCHGH